jgi:wyosine [tRNA(Phe)-imidazoG37] synthetase (radical SAM superfamily)
MDYKHIFGPIQSRRLGVSLGIDIVPSKTCSFDCVYCEAGRTTKLTLKRKPYFICEEVINELTDFLKQYKGHIDYITFSGKGEPTLNSEIGKMIIEIKEKFPKYKLCLITNTTVLYMDNLLNDILPCDLIMPSLDAISYKSFNAINRPHPKIKPEMMINSLIQLRRIYKNQYWLEIFFIEGVNDTEREISLFRDACMRTKPDKVLINSLDRHGVETWVKKMSQERLEYIKDFLKDYNPVIV